MSSPPSDNIQHLSKDEEAMPSNQPQMVIGSLGAQPKMHLNGHAASTPMQQIMMQQQMQLMWQHQQQMQMLLVMGRQQQQHQQQHQQQPHPPHPPPQQQQVAQLPTAPCQPPVLPLSLPQGLAQGFPQEFPQRFPMVQQHPGYPQFAYANLGHPGMVGYPAQLSGGGDGNSDGGDSGNDGGMGSWVDSFLAEAAYFMPVEHPAGAGAVTASAATSSPAVAEIPAQANEAAAEIPAVLPLTKVTAKAAAPLFPAAKNFAAKLQRSPPAVQSKFLGVRWDRREERWNAGIVAEEGYNPLGSFATEEAAARRYDEAAAAAGKPLNFVPAFHPSAAAPGASVFPTVPEGGGSGSGGADSGGSGGAGSASARPHASSCGSESDGGGRRDSTAITPVSSTFVGVSFNRKNQKWLSQITVKGKQVYLGSFHSEQEAAARYFWRSLCCTSLN